MGVWMMLAPAMWTYGDAGGLDARWNDVAAGSIVAGIGIARLIRPARWLPLTVTATAVGTWLLVAPFALAYGYGEHATRAAVSDVVIGILVVVLTISGPAAASDQDGTR
jgi:hypothetical protein